MELFFASTGRMGRMAFLVAVAVLLGLFWAYERWVQGGLYRATGWLVHFILFVAAISVLAKRLHDRGRSGWWAALIVLAFDLAWPWPQGAVGWSAGAALVLVALDLGAMPGQSSFNRFGPPLQR